MTARRAEAGDAVVGQNIRVHRLARRMSQSALADAIGITFQQVQKYEKGVNRVGAARLVRIARALGVPTAKLLAGIEAVDKGGASPLALIAERQPLRLAQAFAAIRDRAVRRTLVQLTEQIAQEIPGRAGRDKFAKKSYARPSKPRLS
jgi:transcriptional regulator with XRE-family HTH domain